MNKLPDCENYRIKTVENIYKSTRKEREEWIKEAKYNLFNLESHKVFIDLLTDSGTGAMSDRQWAAMMSADESYAGSHSFFELKETITNLTGYNHIIPVHQGRAAENVLFSALVKEGHIIPGNAHFDTTKGHIEFRKATAIDCTIKEAQEPNNPYPFKGNLDLDRLEEVYKEHGKDKIPFCLITITCNSVGGQPVSMQNIKDVTALSNQYNIPVLFDAARYAENAYFIQQREEAYSDVSIKEIIHEMFSYGEGMTMSSKKDGLVNIGGFIALKSEELYRQASQFCIIYEGYITYGGMSGRDMAGLAQGLKESCTEQYLKTRISQIEFLASEIQKYGIPIQTPPGGHAVFIDAYDFLPNVDKSEFAAQTLAIELYKESGVRGVEIGTLLADRDPNTRENRYPEREWLRLTIPRRTYTNSHMAYVAAALGNVYQKRDSITKGYQIVREADIMRHFTVELETVKQ